MGLTILGVVLGAIVSWVITHTYYRMAERKAARDDPFFLLTQVSADIATLRESVSSPSTDEARLREALQRSQTQIDRIRHVLRASLQNWFSEFTALKVSLEQGDQDALTDQVARMDGMMKTMASRMKDSEGGEPLPTSNPGGGERINAR